MAERQIGEEVERTLHLSVSDVTCPEDVDVEPNTTFECTAEVGASEPLRLSVRIVNDDADLRLFGARAE
jgi:Domain of unknown function (DUF4333)